jgi:hypothetical protein
VKHRLLNLLTALSLLLCVAAVALWVRSYVVDEECLRSSLDDRPDAFRSTLFSLATWRGVLGISIHRQEFDGPALSNRRYAIELDMVRSLDFEARNWRWTKRRPESFQVTRGRPLSGFGFGGWVVNERGVGWRNISVGWRTPFWFLLLLFGLTPSLRLIGRLRKRRKLKRGVCAVCGYDLRATPGRCPECGTLPPQAVAT